MVFCFFFKQKTAYEMRISDWSSDVCLSDLGQAATQCGRAALPFRRTVKRGFLRGVVVGDGQGHQLFQRGGSGTVVGQQARRDVGEFESALHHQRGHAEVGGTVLDGSARSEEHTSELQSLMRISYAGLCSKKTSHHRNYISLQFC